MKSSKLCPPEDFEDSPLHECGERLADEIRHTAQRQALIFLTQTILVDGSGVLQALQRIAEVTAATLGVARVSVWRFNIDRSALECLELYEHQLDKHSAGAVLNAADYPAYFKELAGMGLNAANDAHTNPATREFSKGYLTPLGIGSMMDVPIHFENSVDYVLCNEHVGSAREWREDEKTFAVAIANLISLVLQMAARDRSQRGMVESHERFELLTTATNDTIWDWDLATDAFWWKDGLSGLFGWAATGAEMKFQVRKRQIHPEDRDRVVLGMQKAIQGNTTEWAAEYRFLNNEGKISLVHDRGHVIRDAAGKALRMVGWMTDLTSSREAEMELKLSHRALQMLSACNEMLIRMKDEKELLADACRLAVEMGGYRMAWAGQVMEGDDKRILPIAHAGSEDGYLSEVSFSWSEDEPSGRGPVGQAVRSGEPIEFGDILENSAFLHWLTPAVKRGYRSVIALPLKDERRVFGVITLYRSEAYPTSAAELKLLREMANNLAFGIVNFRSRIERQRAQEVVVKVAEAVSRSTGSEFFNRLTHSMVEAMGCLGGLIGKHHAADNSIESISYCLHGEVMENVSYGLDGTPCAEVMKGNVCVFAQGVQKQFPEDHLLVTLDVQAYAGIPLFNQAGHGCHGGRV
jgi:PAS domain S-box-containing protein